jgi:hypothetical protein
MAEPTTQYNVTSNIPEWAKEYATKLLGRAEALTEPIYDPKTGLYKPQYTPYGGQLVAGFNPLQEQAMRDVARMDVAPEMGQATGFTGLAALQAQNLGDYNPLAQQQYYRSPLDRPGGLNKYMSPYMQGVVEQQKSQAVRDYARQIPGLQAAGIRAGARGGTREALLQAEGQRGLNEQLQNIQATGLQNAFQQAQAQASQDAQLRAQYGLAGTQLGEQSRQFGANLGMQGLQQQLAAARQLADIGGATQAQRQNILQAQFGAGQQAQDQEQRRLSTLYQQFIDEQQAPFKQLGFMSDILRGTPASATTTSIYQQPPNFLASTIGGAGGLATLFGGLGK